mmetsp:Transcript_44865/g.72218  ORF Transcript_44865/g.72218 Transcript_44865/m.72218 type:complete len:211 (-) Transcript_44865:511-1143(-)
MRYFAIARSSSERGLHKDEDGFQHFAIAIESLKHIFYTQLHTRTRAHCQHASFPPSTPRFIKRHIAVHFGHDAQSRHERSLAKKLAIAQLNDRTVLADIAALASVHEIHRGAKLTSRHDGFAGRKSYMLHPSHALRPSVRRHTSLDQAAHLLVRLWGSLLVGTSVRELRFSQCQRRGWFLLSSGRTLSSTAPRISGQCYLAPNKRRRRFS